MPTRVYYEKDVDPATLRNQTIAVLGYGSQGSAHARNLRDAGHHVIVAQRPGGPNHALAIEHGFHPISLAEAAQQADLLIFALPDEAMTTPFNDEVKPHLRPGQALGFIHGFAIRFGQVVPPANVDVILVAPKGPGSLVRSAYERGGGLTCMIGVEQDVTGHALQTALAWGVGIGGGRGGMMSATFAEECEADLFGEQAVLCGGIIELMKAAFETLIEAGFSAEVAYFECIHEVKQIVDMQYAKGLAKMRAGISNTAAYGGLTRGPQVVTEETRQTLRTILSDIQSGRFAAEWIEECRQGRKELARRMAEEATHPSEPAGERVRTLAQHAVPELSKRDESEDPRDP